MQDTVHVKGLSDLAKFLEQLPAKMEANIMRAALRAGAKVVMEEAKRNVPVSLPNLHNMMTYGGYRGALRDSIRVTTRLKKGKVTASIKAGAVVRGADVYYANWVEYGTAAHTIRVRNAKSLHVGGGFPEFVKHPGAKPHPFMRPALDSQSQAALVAVGEAIKKRLTKQGLNTADIEVEAA